MRDNAIPVPCVITFENLTLSYDRHPVIHHLDGCIEKGQFCALVGPNGAGKSTLLKAITEQVKPSQGCVCCSACSVAYLPQRAQMDCTFPMTVKDVVLTGVWPETGAFKAVKKHHKKAVSEALASVGLAGYEKNPLTALSGGQFQRVLFARMLMQDAELLLLDEPFVGVDEQTIADLMQLLVHLNEQGKTIVMVSHDLNWVREHIPFAFLISTELIASGESANVLTEKNLSTARALNSRRTESAGVCENTLDVRPKHDAASRERA